MKYYLWITSFVMLFLGVSCTKNNIIINIDPDDWADSSHVAGNDRECLVNFYASMEGNITKTLTPFPAGAVATIFAYKYGDVVKQLNYKSVTDGTLTPVDEDMVLQPGTYTFYAISLRSSSFPDMDNFTDDDLQGLSNGIDYLWYSVGNHTISSSGTTVPITFTHSACQVVLNFSATEVSSLSSVLIQQPKISYRNTWSLVTGQIISAYSLSQTSLPMDINSVKASVEMIPLTSTEDLNVDMELTRLGATSSTVYTMSIPVPNSNLIAGSSYVYTISFKGNLPVIGNVNIAPWNEVDNSTPIYPTPN